MKRILLIGLMGMMLFAGMTGAEGTVGTVMRKVTQPDDWLSRKSLKYGYIITAGVTNSIRMSLEADKWSGRGYGNDYHLKRTGEILGYVALGYLTYAVLNRDTWTWKDKVNLIGGTVLLAQVAGETCYQGGMHGWGNALNGNPDWHRNELFWVQRQNGFPWVKDDMLATNEWSTPAYKLLFVGLGANRIGKVR